MSKHLTEEEEAAWRLYLKLQPIEPSPVRPWGFLDKDSQRFYLNLWRHIKAAADKLATTVEKEVYSKLVNQEHWT